MNIPFNALRHALAARGGGSSYEGADDAPSFGAADEDVSLRQAMAQRAAGRGARRGVMRQMGDADDADRFNGAGLLAQLREALKQRFPDDADAVDQMADDEVMSVVSRMHREAEA